jgi:TRAF3-interacting protein 1
MAEDLQTLIPITRDALSALISRPKLHDKLLGKPPFRFLHDVFLNIIKETGFAEGLYTDEELDASTISGKKPKMAFLDKMILCVGIAQGSAVDVRSGKIVAGLEPECTNVFLQVGFHLACFIFQLI